MAKKAKVDPAICIGCGTCVALCGASFKMGDDGKSVAIDPAGNSEQEVQGAIDACPVKAISWEEVA